jgi:signal transduction histidine kinase
MNFETILVVFILLISAFVGIGLTIFAIRRRNIPGTLPFALVTAGIAEWSFAYALEIAWPGVAAKIIWAQFQYIGLAVIPVGWFLFSCQYSQRYPFCSIRVPFILLIIPAITVILAFTNPLHNWHWAGITLSEEGPLQVIQAVYGPWWFIFFVYSYGLLLAGSIILFRALRQYSSIYRWQITTLLFGLILPWLANALYITRLSPIPQLDLSPFAFTVSALAIEVAIFRYRLFDLNPVTTSTLIDEISKPALILDKKWRIVDINNIARQEFFEETGSHLGKSAVEALPWWDSIAEEISHNIEIQKEITWTKNNLQRFYSINVTPIWNNAQTFTGYMLVIRDMTSEKVAEEAIALSKIKSEFIAKVGHELRTPLTSLLGISEMLNMGVYGPISENQTKAIDLIAQSAKHIVRLANDLLEQSRFERGTFRLDNKSFNLSDLLDRLNRDFSAAAEQKGLQLNIYGPGHERTEIFGDETRVYQILSNLVENAIKFTFQGYIKVMVSRPNHESLLIEVRDTGIGIPKEYQNVIFSPFKQLECQDYPGKSGLGLGLSIVKQLVELMNGEIYVESEVGKGSVFTCNLTFLETEISKERGEEKSQ